jgi:competence protein ComEC
MSKIPILVGLVITFILISTGCSYQSTEKLSIHFIDVDWGDSILVDLNETEILIDGGVRDRDATVAAYLSKHVDGPLEVMVVTHGHHDHVGGLIAVLDDYRVEEVWLKGTNSAGFALTGFSKRVELEGSKVNEIHRGDSIHMGQLSFDVLNPTPLENAYVNNNSIVLRMTYGKVTALFTGDIQKNAEVDILESGQLVQADILKVAHHGTATSSTTPFLEAVKPKLAICQSIGQAHPEVISRLTDIGAEVYITEFHGTIVISTDGETYTIETEKQPEPR